MPAPRRPKGRVQPDAIPSGFTQQNFITSFGGTGAGVELSSTCDGKGNFDSKNIFKDMDPAEAEAWSKEFGSVPGMKMGSGGGVIPGFPGVPASAAPATTISGLADQLHQILTPGGSRCDLSVIESAILKKNTSFLESKTVLIVLNSAVGKTPALFEQSVLKKLKNPSTIEHVHFYPVPGWDDSDPLFDFQQFSAQMQKHLPKWKTFHVEHMLVKNFSIHSTTLESLKLIDPQLKDGNADGKPFPTWDLNLPNLRVLTMENHSPPVANFAQALINSPYLEVFFCHKYWHLDSKNEELPLPELYLPSCREFTFRRGDRTETLKLYLPRVRKLTLDACYCLKTFRLLNEGCEEHAALDEGRMNLGKTTNPSRFQLSLINANLSEKALRRLGNSDRVCNKKMLQQPRQENAGVGQDAHFCRQWANDNRYGKDDKSGFGEMFNEDDSDGDGDEPAYRSLRRGDKVVVTQLLSRPELVGTVVGTIVKAVLPNPERVGVKFPNGEELAIKKVNLELWDGDSD